ncbi:MAG: hypothetical protein ACK2UR_05655 [Candidatus Promineifilaceae bacterium]|jgi:hypothetical protein
MPDEFKESKSAETTDAPATQQNNKNFGETGTRSAQGISDEDLLASLPARREQQDKEMREDAAKIDERIASYRVAHPENGEIGIRSIQGIIEDGEQQNFSDEDLLASLPAKREQLDKEMREDAGKIDERTASYHAAHPENQENHNKEVGVVDVPVADLPWPDGIHGPQDFTKISYAEALHATEQLQQMKPLIDQGYGSEDFKHLDQANGLNPENGLERVYKLYYGDDKITAFKDGDNYFIDHGRHRIFAAKQVGIDTLPVFLVEKI